MDDLTIIYYTANLVRPSLQDGVLRQLFLAVGTSPVISVSQKPMNCGTKNICVGDIGQHVWNIYYQLLLGAKAAKTKYVATAEDDILYPREHFHTERPPDGALLYDTNRWLLFTWKRPEYTHKGRIINGMMMCERDLLVDALEERFKCYPTPESIDIKVFGEVGRNERELGVTPRKVARFKAMCPSVMFNHEDSICYASMGKHKGSGVTPTDWLSPWGYASDILKMYKGE